MKYFQIVMIFFICIFFKPIFATPILEQRSLNANILKNSADNWKELYKVDSTSPPISINHPIPTVLVHGFNAAARTQGIMDYWGGYYGILDHKEGSFQKQLIENTNAPVFVAEISSFNSNYDRAIELFAQIKGSCVIYGKQHAEHFKHLAYYPQEETTAYYISRLIPFKNELTNQIKEEKVRCYPGFYPEWDNDHPINLVGHSMGGQTIRYLASLIGGTPLLDYKNSQTQSVKFKSDPIISKYLFCSSIEIIEKEKALTQDTEKMPIDCSENITAKSIHSITTVASPHLGTTLSTPIIHPELTLKNVTLPFKLSEFMIDLLGKINEKIPKFVKTLLNYDFWLDHWQLNYPNSVKVTNLDKAVNFRLGIGPNPDKGSALSKTNDFSATDMTIIGSKDLTLTMNEESIIDKPKYYSIASRSSAFTIPTPSTYLGNAISIISKYSQKDPDLPKVGKELWLNNDGYVNTISQLGPHNKNILKYNPDTIKKCNLTPKYNFKSKLVNLDNYKNLKPINGEWTFICLFDGFDHTDVIGWLGPDSEILNLYSFVSHNTMIGFYSNHINYVNSK